MGNDEQPLESLDPSTWQLAPIHRPDPGAPLRICVYVRPESSPVGGPFVLLRELPGSRAYLGAVCDADARVQEWVEVWVQTLELRDLAFSNYQERLTNFTFDQRWHSEYQAYLENLPESVIVTGMEENNPPPILIEKQTGQKTSGFAIVDPAKWRICKDDALLTSLGLPPYSTSPFRYLHDPEATGAKAFLSTATDAPANSHVQGIERLSDGARAVFNPHAGLVRVNRFTPLGLDEYLQVLEGAPWNGMGSGATRLFPRSVYAELQTWSAVPKGIPFLLRPRGDAVEGLNEIFFLKLSALRDLFKEVRSYVKSQQLPLLNLSPASFGVHLGQVGEQFPALWTAKCELVKPGQAYPLQIKSTAQKYFIRLGRIEPSPFLPEGLAAHSFGIGSIRIREVKMEADGVVLDGTLVAEDYLGLDAHDLLWFKLPMAEERMEFFAHVYLSEAVGPKEARFRTVPARLPDPVVASLKRAAGTVFPRSPYEIWPLLSSPCDLFSLGVIAVRTLLANGKSNLPVILDEVQSLARHAGRDTEAGAEFIPILKSALERDSHLFDLVSPQALIESADSPEQARSKINLELWLEAMALMLRLFPGASPQSFCSSFGDVSPLALETVFDRPLQELDGLLLRLRSILVPGLSANEEIASAILEQMAAT
ncbi:MAG TPA: hypothetical protein VG938_03890 [Verrucomicrobiae bacterium]|jgi:hypothetical protein|nr:hypothetical protein [Verrucomicrobiae bacterium]